KFRLENPDLVKNAPSIAELSQNEVPRIANKFNQAINGLNSEAKKIIPKSSFLESSPTDQGGAFTKDEVMSTIDKARKELGGVYTPEAESASKTLAKLKGDLKKIRTTVSQNQVHDYIMDLDREIPWQKVWRAPETLTMTDNAMIDIRTSLDRILKDKNPA